MGRKKENETGRFAEVYSRVNTGIFNLVSSLELTEKPLVRKALGKIIRGIEIENIPDTLSKATILVSNYPGIQETLKAVMKVGFKLPDELSLVAIARREIVTETPPALGGLLYRRVLPADKNEAGRYSLNIKNTARALRHLKEGGVLWLSPTGSVEANGLRVKNLRHGAVIFAQKANVPILPMGLITNQDGKVERVKFGEPITLPPEDQVSLFDRDVHLDHFSLLVLAEIAKLLPPGQRGDFEDNRVNLL